MYEPIGTIQVSVERINESYVVHSWPLGALAPIVTSSPAAECFLDLSGMDPSGCSKVPRRKIGGYTCPPTLIPNSRTVYSAPAMSRMIILLWLAQQAI